MSQLELKPRNSWRYKCEKFCFVVDWFDLYSQSNAISYARTFWLKNVSKKGLCYVRNNSRIRHINDVLLFQCFRCSANASYNGEKSWKQQNEKNTKMLFLSKVFSTFINIWFPWLRSNMHNSFAEQTIFSFLISEFV